MNKDTTKKLRTTAMILSIAIAALIVYSLIAPLCLMGLFMRIADALSNTPDKIDHAYDGYSSCATQSGCMYITLIIEYEERTPGGFCSYDGAGDVTYIIGEKADGEQVYIVSGDFTDTDIDYRLGEWRYAYSLSEIAERMTAHGVPCRKTLFDAKTIRSRDFYACDFSRLEFVDSQNGIDNCNMQDVMSERADFNGLIRYYTPDIPKFVFYIVQEHGELMMYYREQIEYNEYGPMYSVKI